MSAICNWLSRKCCFSSRPAYERVALYTTACDIFEAAVNDNEYSLLANTSGEILAVSQKLRSHIRPSSSHLLGRVDDLTDETYSTTLKRFYSGTEYKPSGDVTFMTGSPTCLTSSTPFIPEMTDGQPVPKVNSSFKIIVINKIAFHVLKFEPLMTSLVTTLSSQSLFSNTLSPLALGGSSHNSKSSAMMRHLLHNASNVLQQISELEALPTEIRDVERLARCYLAIAKLRDELLIIDQLGSVIPPLQEIRFQDFISRIQEMAKRWAAFQPSCKYTPSTTDWRLETVKMHSEVLAQVIESCWLQLLLQMSGAIFTLEFKDSRGKVEVIMTATAADYTGIGTSRNLTFGRSGSSISADLASLHSTSGDHYGNGFDEQLKDFIGEDGILKCVKSSLHLDEGEGRIVLTLRFPRTKLSIEEKPAPLAPAAKRRTVRRVRPRLSGGGAGVAASTSIEDIAAIVEARAPHEHFDLNIAVVDDEPVNRLTIQKFLERIAKEHRPIKFSIFESADELYADYIHNPTKFNVIFMDIMMGSGQTSGDEIARRIHFGYNGTLKNDTLPIVVMSGNTSVADMDKYVKNGMERNPSLRKPFYARDVKSAVLTIQKRLYIQSLKHVPTMGAGAVAAEDVDAKSDKIFVKKTIEQRAAEAGLGAATFAAFQTDDSSSDDGSRTYSPIELLGGTSKTNKELPNVPDSIEGE
ncbi:MAG: response regulator [Rhabdochlamydiaceae bacterium]|nr:response regulator [Candidatus Amphrikana amoebophyrae]